MDISIAALDATREPDGQLAPLDKGKAGYTAGVPWAEPHAPRTWAGLPSYELRSTVRYRIKGRTLTGDIIGIAHGDPSRYDIRPHHGMDGEPNAVDRVSFGVPPGDIEQLLAPPSDRQKVIVMSDLPPEPPAPMRQRVSWRVHRSFLAGLLGI